MANYVDFEEVLELFESYGWKFFGLLIGSLLSLTNLTNHHGLFQYMTEK